MRKGAVTVKRLYLCISIMTLIVLSSAASLWVIRSGNEQLYSLAAEIKYVYGKGEDATAELKEFCDCWEKYYVRVSYFAASDSLNTVYSGVFRLQRLLEENSDEFIPELESICGQTKMLYRSQFPHLYSVL